jgi:hypothetical protein
MGLEHPENVNTLAPRTRMGIGLITGLLVVWFLFAWLVLDRHFLDAAGESVGSAFVLGIVGSLIAALRGG